MHLAWLPRSREAETYLRMAEATVKERLESGKQDNDMLGSFLSHGMSPKQAEAEILTQLCVYQMLKVTQNLLLILFKL